MSFCKVTARAAIENLHTKSPKTLFKPRKNQTYLVAHSLLEKSSSL